MTDGERLVVLKWDLRRPVAALTELTRLALPAGTQVLTVADQDGELMLWTLSAYPFPPDIERVFLVVGTGFQFGREAGERLVYVGTALTGRGLVWHVFERTGQG